MTITVLFFGALRDLAGISSESLQAPDAANLGTIFDLYAERIPQFRSMEKSIVLARNRQFANRATALEDGDEIAFLPPVSGGSDRYTQSVADPDGSFYGLTRETIDSAGLRRSVARDDDGALVVFEGIVRNNTKGRPTIFLEYECYEAMAINVMATIGRDLANTHQIGRLAIVHRLGRLEIGEASIVIAVASPHRKAAFEVAREAIDRVKRMAPIWKKEHFADGEVWVDGEWDASVIER